MNNLLCVNSVKKPTYWLYNIIKKLWIDISQNEAEIKYEISGDLEYYTKEKLSILNEKLDNVPEEEELKIKTLNKEISKYEKLYYQLGDTMIINKIWEIGKGRLSYSAYNTNKFDVEEALEAGVRGGQVEHLHLREGRKVNARNLAEVGAVVVRHEVAVVA